MDVGIYTNCKKDVGLTVTKKLIAILTQAKIGVFLHRDLERSGLNGRFFDEADKKPFTTLLTIGGDGTILRIAAYCAANDIAILGINLGKVGFLTEIELNMLDRLPDMLLRDAFERERRSLLSVKIDGATKYALNEIVLSRNMADRMIAIAVHIDGRLVDKYYCDGYIVSTPTGSTAYSLSAGGSVLSPKTQAFCLLPINSHSLHSRPIVVDDNDKVELSLLNGSEDCVVIADGQQIGEIKAGRSVPIVKAEKQLVFLRLKESNFYEKLLAKLNTWSVTQ